MEHDLTMQDELGMDFDPLDKGISEFFNRKADQIECSDSKLDNVLAQIKNDLPQCLLVKPVVRIRWRSWMLSSVAVASVTFGFLFNPSVLQTEHQYAATPKLASGLIIDQNKGNNDLEGISIFNNEKQETSISTPITMEF